MRLNLVTNVILLSVRKIVYKNRGFRSPNFCLVSPAKLMFGLHPHLFGIIALARATVATIPQ